MKKIYDSKSDVFWDAFGLEAEKVPILSFIGAGGKTSLIKTLSEELSKKGIEHGIMTTTHMWPVEKGKYRSQLGEVTKEGKVLPPGEMEIQELFAKKCPVLIEADGARGLPCKAPEAWEPVIRPETSHLFAMFGASCLGRPVKYCCHRPGKVMEILQCSPEHFLTLEDIGLLASDHRGLYRKTENGRFYGVIINQVDNEDIYKKMKPLKSILLERGIENLWFVGTDYE